MRKFVKGDQQARYASDKEDREYISRISGGRGSAELRGQQIGLSAEALIRQSLSDLHQREKEIKKLLQHLPRKFEQRVRGLERPLARAHAGFDGARIIIENTRDALGPVSDEAGD